MNSLHCVNCCSIITVIIWTPFSSASSSAYLKNNSCLGSSELDAYYPSPFIHPSPLCPVLQPGLHFKNCILKTGKWMPLLPGALSQLWRNSLLAEWRLAWSWLWLFLTCGMGEARVLQHSFLLHETLDKFKQCLKQKTGQEGPVQRAGWD